jgi:hypothetical protein
MTPGSNGPAPDGIWNLGPMESVPTDKKGAASYGDVGFIPFTDPPLAQTLSQRQLGVHSGRGDNVKYLTYGCIRTTNAAMKFMQAHPPNQIEINPVYSHSGHPIR